MKKILNILVLIIIIFVTSAKFGQVFAQSYKMELENPGTEINVNDTFNVKILINTGQLLSYPYSW